MGYRRTTGHLHLDTLGLPINEHPLRQSVSAYIDSTEVPVVNGAIAWKDAERPAPEEDDRENLIRYPATDIIGLEDKHPDEVAIKQAIWRAIRSNTSG